MAHFHCETKEGTETAEETEFETCDDELLMWLQQNDLLDARNKLMNCKRKVTLDFLKQIDPIFLNGFIKDDLGLDGILAFYFSSAIKKLQIASQERQLAQSTQIFRTIVLSHDEGKAINEIKNRYKEATQYLNQLNHCITSLSEMDTQNQNAINEFRANIVQKINDRMDELIQISHTAITEQKKQILSRSKRIKSYQSALSKAQRKHKQLLNDNDLDELKREGQILKVNENINDNYHQIMQNKPMLNHAVSVELGEMEMNKSIKSCGEVRVIEATSDNTCAQKRIQQNEPPKPPMFSVEDANTTEHGTEAKMSFEEVKSNVDLECYVETCDGMQSCRDSIDDDPPWSPWSKRQPFAAQKHYTLRLSRLGTPFGIRARYKSKHGWSEYSEEVEYTTRGHRVCFDGNGYVLMADNSCKQICELKIGDKVRSFPNAVASVRCRITQNVNDTMEMVQLKNDCWITCKHPVLVQQDDKNCVEWDLNQYKNIDTLDTDLIEQYGLMWVLPKHIQPITLKYQEKIYNFVLDSLHTINVNGNWCCTLGHDYKGSVIEHELWGNSIAIKSFLQSNSTTYPDVVFV
eukprot:221116_1